MLDAVDAVLVRELQRDGRATFQALADRVGLSRTAVRARVQHLLETQVVRVVGIVHAAVVGAEAIGHVSVTVDGSAREVAKAVAERPAVSFAALTAGPYDLVAQVRTRDDAALAAEVDQIRSVPGVRAAEVFRSVSTVRDTHTVVRELGEVTLDDIDWRLLHELQRDGRAPYTRLAHVIGLSQAATRARVVRLMRTGVIQVTGLADPLALGAAELGGFGLVVTGGLRAVADAVAAQDGVRYLATGFGRYDIVGQAEAASRGELVSVLDAIRSVPGVTVRESWHHLDVVKESYTVELPAQPLNGSS
ncbi:MULTISPECIES: Lrp/AsnC family transcriptional regulator [Actinomadura]|uniref:DNA-binding transcriptional regulator, Lrp family n=1 Tax=Actinomadura madurae TaxID=1993 RepID=A0A1I5H5D9_9ACTN|nr:Lrp/AsnC family transcriptional regulator [Actinomadura madurae]MCP9947023.1 Lrp/AsnC family transcriptional regulator [Actinomadura madurae]MCP9963792.1 Lrp/AsnC family transcriptional regulator [Actinomadura madurae]MCP9976270.1 Lrp/AsnC family transcriptional regulator [Actinomadura madurae]MCQ0012241.1 Lrp/AsnC family transcriptional regulator [Actinomadura madurae]MCQ0012457.1 Lrp/AsnC family transcriptional regulator [Actinomadura madurae]